MFSLQYVPSPPYLIVAKNSPKMGVSAAMPKGAAVFGRGGLGVLRLLRLVDRRLAVLLLCSLALGVIVLSMTAGVLRDNDQAAYVEGAIQLASSSTSVLQFYDYDKQYGTAWLLAGALWLFPTADPILVCNLVQVMLAGIALAMLVSRLWRDRRISLILLLPIYCSPAMVFSLAFLGTSAMSFCFLVAAFAVYTGRGTWIEKTSVCALVAVAAACRADAILVLPALILASTPRTTFAGLFRRPFNWALAAAAVSPILIGQLAFGHTPNTAPLFFDGKVLTGFIVFGLGAGAFLLMLALSAAFVVIALVKRRWCVFYALCAFSVLIPFLFYVPQLYTPRYFFPTLAVILFWIGGRRIVPILAAWRRHRDMRFGLAGVVVLSIAPWFVGLSAPSLRQVGLTFAHATEFPSAKGYQPMGAYLSYLFAAKARGFVLDHNEKTWIEAKSVNYQTCGGVVPVVETPMAAYMGLAARLQGKNTIYVTRFAEAKCGFAYAEARALTRAKRALANLDDPPLGQFPPDILRRRITLASMDNSAGQPILRIDDALGPTDVGTLLAALRLHFGGREIEIYLTEGGAVPSVLTIDFERPFDYAVFAMPEGSCGVSENGSASHPPTRPDDPLLVAWGATSSSESKVFAVSCSETAMIGWARTTLPPYVK